MAMMGGEVDEVVMPVSTAMPQIRAGRCGPLAVLTEQRIPTLPDVPTGIEAGVDGFTMPLWYGMFAPAATPRDIVSRLSRELVKVLETPDMRERLDGPRRRSLAGHARAARRNCCARTSSATGKS